MTILSLVIPIFNEASHLEETLEVISSHVQKAEVDYEIIIVDDGSQDDSWQIIERLAQHELKLRGIRLSRNFGKENAIAAGISAAKGQAVIVMDADLQHPPHLIPVMVGKWQAGEGDIIEAVKQPTPHDTKLRGAFSSLYYSLYASLLGIEISQATDFKLLDRKVVQAWSSFPERAVFFRGLVSWLGFRTLQIPFAPPDRQSGESKFTYRKLFDLALVSLLSFTALPLYLIPAAGSVFLLFAFILGGVSLSQWLSGSAVEGFTTVIILQLFIGGMVLCSLGIIGVYLSKLYEEVKGRPRYVVAKSTDSQDLADKI